VDKSTEQRRLFDIHRPPRPDLLKRELLRLSERTDGDTPLSWGARPEQGHQGPVRRFNTITPFAHAAGGDGHNQEVYRVAAAMESRFRRCVRLIGVRMEQLAGRQVSRRTVVTLDARKHGLGGMPIWPRIRRVPVRYFRDPAASLSMSSAPRNSPERLGYFQSWKINRIICQQLES